MRSFHPRPRRLRSLATIFLSIALTFVPWIGSGGRIQAQEAGRTDISFAGATANARGVLVEWRSSDKQNLGFNIYRVQAGSRTRINGQVIGGAAFTLSRRLTSSPSDFSYSWFDPSGTAGARYEIESVSVSGETRIYKGVVPIRSKGVAESIPNAGPNGSANSSESYRPAEEIFPEGSKQLNTATGAIEDQWAIAGKPGLKIHIKRDGWYRVTQQQMAAAGFSPTVDVRNLQLFTDGREVAIRTSKDVGQYIGGDFIEFYAQALDTPTADTRIYYLIAGTAAGKRIEGDLHLDGVVDPPSTTPSTGPGAIPIEGPRFGWLLQFYNGTDSSVSTQPATQPAEAATTNKTAAKSPEKPPLFKFEEVTTQSNTEVGVPAAPSPDTSPSSPEPKSVPPAPIRQLPVVPEAKATKVAKKPVRRGNKKSTRLKRKTNRHRNHAVASAAAAGSFNSTVEIRERYHSDVFHPVYYLILLNGDTENYFGRVIAGSPVIQTISAPNPELTAEGPVKLEIALQGVLGQFGFNHVVNVDFNGTQVGSLNFGPIDHLVSTVDIPVSQLLSGTNTIKLTKVSTGDVCLVDYLRLTYPHALKADNNSLRFGLRSSLSTKIDGFASPNVRLIDYSDPFAVKVTRPSTQATALGYAINVPAGTVRAKAQRLLYANLETQFDQPAALSLNQPSTLNAVANGADLVIVAHKTLIPSAAPLASLRQSQGMAVSVVDVEDVFDEFSFGAHSPYAIKDFLSRAKASWTTKPRYVIFLGDSSQDPRNYEAVGDFDLVPTKLVDATFNETASDDWLTDFDNDGIGDIPTGRLPVRTPAEAAIAISKIVNFAPSNAPQTAMLVADDPTNYYFNFETANDEVEGFLHSLVPGMTVQRINKRTDPNAHTNIVNNLNQGLALVNYSGHGNVNTWTGANIFTTPDAANATNGNKLPLVLVMNCLNGYFQDPRLEGIAEGFIKAPAGGAVAVFASSGETIPDGQHEMGNLLYQLLYGSQSIALGDAIKTAKGATFDIDVRRTWIFFGDPSMKIR
jgi:hypothetical protein